MDFYDRFELLDLVMDEGVKTFEARELATGRPVRVHLFVAPKAPLQAALLKALDQLPPTEAKRIVDRGKNEGTPYVVTDRLVDHKSLQDWVLSVAKQMPAKAATPPGTAPPQADSPQAGLGTAGAWKLPMMVPSVAVPSELAATAEVPLVPGAPSRGSQVPAEAPPPQLSEFTRMFQAPPAAVPVPAAMQNQPDEFTGNLVAPTADRAPTPPQRKPPAEPGEFTREPGEFTRMFVAPAPPASAPTAATPATPTQKPAEPGEFTRMFVAPVAGTAPTPPPAPAQKKPAEAGEFTRMFQAPPAAQPASPAKPAAGEFTRMFQAAPPTPPPQSSPSNASAPGEFTQFFKTPNPSGPLPSSPAVEKLTPQAPGSAGANRVGEFTRMFGKADLPVQETGTAAGSAAPLPVPSPNLVAPVTAPVSGTATQAFSVTPPPPAASVQAAPSPLAGPGDFTRQFSAPVALTLGQPSGPGAPLSPAPLPRSPQFSAPQFTPPQVSAPQVSAPQMSSPQFTAPSMAAPSVALPQPAMPQIPASAPAGPAKSNNLPLILGIAAIVVIAVVVILYFALRKH